MSFKFYVEPDSTAKQNKQEQLDELERIVTGIGKFQNLFKDDPRIEVNWPAIMKAYKGLSNVTGASEFVVVKDGPSPQEQALMDENAQLKQELEKTQPTGPAASTLSVNPAGAFNDPDVAAVAQQLTKM